MQACKKLIAFQMLLTFKQQFKNKDVTLETKNQDNFQEKLLNSKELNTDKGNEKNLDTRHEVQPTT
jgi:hypothetical protein